MKAANRIAKLENRAQGLQNKLAIDSFMWADAPPMAKTVEEWEVFVRYEKGETDGSDLRPEFKDACNHFFERQKLGKIYNKNLLP